ncbi:MAG: ATP-binding cassette domain-containing protein [Candidatus Hermodarchaeota archaeon]
MTKNIIETYDLTKIFKLKNGKTITALKNVNISIKEGEIFGLLGPNGAGKTTLISILTTLLKPTSGYATIDGYNIIKKPKEAKSRISLMLESDMLYYRITAYDNLKFFCKIYGISNYEEKINKIANEFGLEKWLNQYVENFSTGMKMKLALCRTLLLERNILFLDEPTVGLDVNSVSFIIDKIKKVNKTILLTSHDMNVVEKLCNRIAFINQGEILKIGTKEYIKNLIQQEIKIDIELLENKENLKSELEKHSFITNIESKNNLLTISIKKRENYKELFSILQNYNIIRFKEIELSLEDLFLEII